MDDDSLSDSSYINYLLAFAVIRLTMTATNVFKKRAQVFNALRIFARFHLGSPDGPTMLAGASQTSGVIMATVVLGPPSVTTPAVPKPQAPS